ncbi:MAG: hypothetical protein G01um101449_291 [Parcubacteria group bacterium Gr01-1014_49]|nr:MAG: hypothetical protein G01um101449_291 [Parcubacteria group bacterium Gr01-1014_49]
MNTLLVTHNFLLEICATPPRPVGLRLSIPGGQNIFLREMFCVGPPGIEPGLHAPEACVLPAYSGPTQNTSYLLAVLSADKTSLRPAHASKSKVVCFLLACALYRIRTYDLSRACPVR